MNVQAVLESVPRLGGWLGIVVQSLTILGVLWAVFQYVVIKPLKEHMVEADKDYTESLARTDKHCTENYTQIAELNKKMQASEFDRAALRQDVGRVEGVVSRNVQQLETIRADAHKDQLELVERLARIETNMNIAAAMDRLGEKIVQALKTK